MENKLEIKFRNQRQFFEILDNEIIADLNTAKHKLKYNIPLEDIKNTHFISRAKHNSFTILAYISFVFNVLLIYYLLVDKLELYSIVTQSIIISAVLFFTYILKLNFEEYDEKHIDSSKLFYFIYTRKNRIEVDKFIELIYKKQIEYFRKNYFIVDSILPYQVQYERYIWLYSNKYISENEFEVIKEDLDKYFNFNPNLNL